MKRWTSWLLATVLTAFLLSCGGKTALDILAVPAEASILDLWKNWKTTELRTAEDLEKLRKNPEGRFELTQDITVNGSTFSPIEEFNGTLNGNGHWIFACLPGSRAMWSQGCLIPWAARPWCIAWALR